MYQFPAQSLNQDEQIIHKLSTFMYTEKQVPDPAPEYPCEQQNVQLEDPNVYQPNNQTAQYQFRWKTPRNWICQYIK